ncbi:DMT family transporter [Ideonella sp.]|uniref:DMT family transporter n=1 Tax=Ideonella sp. TaxID=1929293 RepID=UPI0035AEACCC
MPAAPQTPGSARRGLLLGALGVVIFALTFPMTRLAVGPADAPQLPPGFVTAGRAAGAGLLSVAYLLATRAPWPQRRHLLALVLSALGTVVGFPLGIALALREVPAMHAAVVTGVLPLATAAIAALALRQRASTGFWVCAVLGCLLVLAFAAHEGGGALTGADAWLLVAVFSAAGGYVAGARLAAEWPAEQVISWVLVLSLPLTAPLAWAWWPDAPVAPSAWGGFAYVTLFSMWLGFFAWYRGLALGGALRVSQVQLLQPFLALLFAVPVLGEPLEASTLLFALAVLATVVIGKRMPVRPTAPAVAAPAVQPEVTR